MGLMHNCDADILPWESCRAWCREGYAGSSQTFLCSDDYSFRGVLPTCTAKECIRGIPSGPGVSVDDCLGKTTDQKCEATCGVGYRGSPVDYVCAADGYYREERSGQVDVVPACIEGIPTIVEAADSRASLLIPNFWVLLLL